MRRVGWLDRHQTIRCSDDKLAFWLWAGVAVASVLLVLWPPAPWRSATTHALLTRAVTTSAVVLREIPRANNLSFGELRNRYLATGTPVIVSEAIDSWPAMQWGRNGRFAELCGARSLYPT
eukprot:2352755-Prymnesium_polylepis.1